MIYLFIHSDRPDDHLLSLLWVHVVQANGINLCCQMTANLVGPVKVYKYQFYRIQISLI